jgi:hypothetical protein
LLSISNIDTTMLQTIRQSFLRAIFAVRAFPGFSPFQSCFYASVTRIVAQDS